MELPLTAAQPQDSNYRGRRVLGKDKFPSARSAFYAVLFFIACGAVLFLTSSPAHAACTGPAGAESQTRYDFTSHKLYYCNNTSWVYLGGYGGGSGPSGCTFPGTQCEDGSILAGVVNNQPFYVTDVNQSTSSNWNNATTLCDNLNRHSHTDWYLPSIEELSVLYLNKDVIGGFVTVPYYWSSTENSGSRAWTQSFSGNNQNHYPKSNNYNVRCVRKN